MFFEFCILVVRGAGLFLAFAVPFHIGLYRLVSDLLSEAGPGPAAAVRPVYSGRCLCAADPVAFDAALTVEAALIVSLVLLTLASLLRAAIRWQLTLTGEAGRFMTRPLRYTDGLRPEDLIHIGEFIQEWIPPKS